MNWRIEWDAIAKKKFDKLDLTIRKEILKYMDKRVAPDPTKFGKPLQYDKFGLWRYRVGDYRIICEIKKNIVTVKIINVGHRKDIYS